MLPDPHNADEPEHETDANENGEHADPETDPQGDPDHDADLADDEDDVEPDEVEGDLDDEP